MPPVTEGNCPPGWTKWGTSCYWLQESSLPATWEDCHASCQAREGANLLSIHTQDENVYIQELATVTWGRASVWLGMSRNYMRKFAVFNRVVHLKKMIYVTSPQGLWNWSLK